MFDNDLFHKKSVGASRKSSAYRGMCKYVSYKVREHRLKSALTIGLFAFVLGYLPNRERVDSKIDEFHGSVKEYFDGVVLKSENIVLSNKVSRTKKELGDVYSQKEALESHLDEFKEDFLSKSKKYSSFADSLNGVISSISSEKAKIEAKLDDLAGNFNSSSKAYSGVVDSLNSRIDYLNDKLVESDDLKAKLAEYDRVVSSISAENSRLEAKLRDVEDNIKSEDRYLSIVDSLNERIDYLTEQSFESERRLSKLSDYDSANSSSELNAEKSSKSFFEKVKDFFFGSSSSDGESVVINKSTYKNNLRSGFKQGNSTEYWVAVSPGQSLSDIAKKYYGDPSKYEVLVEVNNLKNPNLVLRNQPIKLVRDDIKHYNGVFQGGLPPLFGQVHTKEDLSGFIGRYDMSVSPDRIIKYNVDRGNNISSNKRLVLDTDVVYLKEE